MTPSRRSSATPPSSTSRCCSWRPPCSTCTARGGRPPTTELGAGSGHTRPSSPGRGPGWRGTWPRRAPGRTTARSSWGASPRGSAATSSSTSSSGSWRGAPSTRRIPASPAGTSSPPRPSSSCGSSRGAAPRSLAPPPSESRPICRETRTCSLSTSRPWGTGRGRSGCGRFDTGSTGSTASWRCVWGGGRGVCSRHPAPRPDPLLGLTPSGLVVGRGRRHPSGRPRGEHVPPARPRGGGGGAGDLAGGRRARGEDVPILRLWQRPLPAALLRRPLLRHARRLLRGEVPAAGARLCQKVPAGDGRRRRGGRHPSLLLL
mmetsp:Transcript_13704/g.40459  ORF Transcript_13704/g.40459 Transcript_13704/m.40459 type:complete len:317 (-) Transcript_13704:148-1098(-)